MSKYDPLGAHLKSQKAARIQMTFDEIERLIGSELPPVARYRAWWSNNATNNVMTKVWLDAGFRSEQVDMAGGRLVFRRAGPMDPTPSPVHQPVPSTPVTSAAPSGTTLTLFGCLKGTVTLSSGLDLTAPAEQAWGEALA